MRKLFIYLIISVSLVFASCANQLPPPGGEDDKIAPKILSVIPSPGTKNFKGDEITIRFDEYVDKRSFIESFSIYPEPPGGTDLSWSGKEVTVKLGGRLMKDRTYVVSLGRDLKDIRGGNALNMPAIFAFSTGSQIDSGKISGTFVSEKFDRAKILLYKIETARNIEPSKQKADYVIQPQDNGVFAFAFLPEGKYRIFGLLDEDRNSLYARDIEKLSIASDDIILKQGEHAADINLAATDLVTDPGSIGFLKTLTSDTTGFVYSNIPGDNKKLDPGAKLYFYFKDNKATKQEIVSEFLLTDSATGNSYKPVFNWLNDSLLEVFSTTKYGTGSKVIAKIDLLGSNANYFFEKQFPVTEKEATSMVSGIITNKDTLRANPKVVLSGLGGTSGVFRSSPDNDGRFIFRNIPEGNYRLIIFEDENDNGLPDKGSYEPFKFSEKTKVYDKEIKVKSGWNVEDVRIVF